MWSSGGRKELCVAERTQRDDLGTGSDDTRAVVIGSTGRPRDLDEARILVDLPDAETGALHATYFPLGLRGGHQWENRTRHAAPDASSPRES